MATSDNRSTEEVGARIPSRLDALWRRARWLLLAVERVCRKYSVASRARWLTSTVVVAIDWLRTGVHQTAGSYMFLLLFIALLLYPDAHAVSVGVLRIERLRTEVADQQAQITLLIQQVQQLVYQNSTLVANTRQNVSIAIGVDSAIACKIAEGEQAPRRAWAAVSKSLAAEALLQGPSSHSVSADVFSDRDTSESGPEPDGSSDRCAGSADGA